MSDLKDRLGYADADYLTLLAEMVRPVKERSYEMMEIKPGNKVLDVGCGPASDTIPIAHLVGEGGSVIGIDHDPEMLEQAEARASAAGVAGWTTHQQGDATGLPFEDNFFDATRSERLFQHVPRAEKILAEMVRVTKPGGKIVVVDTDHSSVSFTNELHDIEWKIRRAHAHKVVNGYSGRHLMPMFKQSGLQDILTEPYPIFTDDYILGRYISVADAAERYALEQGLVTEDELKQMDAHLRELNEKGLYFGYGTMFVVSGTKPR